MNKRQKYLISIVAVFAIIMAIFVFMKNRATVEIKSETTAAKLTTEIVTTEVPSTTKIVGESTTISETTTEEPSVAETTTKKPVFPETTTKPPVETTTKPTTTYVELNADLTWEEAYTDNGDGTFTLVYVDGEVVTYKPHPTEEGTYLRDAELSGMMGLSFEQIKRIWESQWCDVCGKLSGYGDNGTCARFVRDKNCPKCGEFCKAFTCHTCK